MELPAPIKCSDRMVDSRACCYSIIGFAHLPECPKVEECPKLLREAAPASHHGAFNYLKGMRVYDTYNGWWATIRWWWMGAEGWPTVLALTSDSGREYDCKRIHLILATLSFCGNCEADMLPSEDYLCQECRG